MPRSTIARSTCKSAGSGRRSNLTPDRRRSSVPSAAPAMYSRRRWRLFARRLTAASRTVWSSSKTESAANGKARRSQLQFDEADFPFRPETLVVETAERVDGTLELFLHQP